MGDAYKVAQLQGENLSAIQAFYLATLGATKALSLEDDLGNFEVGKEADFAVLDWQATPLMALRNPVAAQALTEVEEILFSLMILGSDRVVTATYVGGEVAIVT
jgi:guanine deaminase